MAEGFGTMHRRQFLMAAIAGGVVIAMPSIAMAGDNHIAKFVGRYKHVGGDKERAARDKAIDESVAGISDLLRNTAREMLKAANAIPTSLEFATDKKHVTVSADSVPFKAPLDGTPVKVKVVTGDMMDLSYVIAKGQVDQMFKGSDRGRNNRYTLNGDKLVMNVRVHATQLPKDLLYRLSYERV